VVNAGKIGTITPSTFRYWVAVNVASAGATTFTINQSITTGNFARLFKLGTGHNVYTSSCTTGLSPTFAQSSVASANGTVTVNFNAPSAGRYYITVKFNQSSVKRRTVPNPTTVHYTWSTTGVSGSSTAFDLVRQ
jgi:hypothetical protein